MTTYLSLYTDRQHGQQFSMPNSLPRKNYVKRNIRFYASQALSTIREPLLRSLEPLKRDISLLPKACFSHKATTHSGTFSCLLYVFCQSRNFYSVTIEDRLNLNFCDPNHYHILALRLKLPITISF